PVVRGTENLFSGSEPYLIKRIEALDFIKWLWVSEKPPENYKIKCEKLLKRIWQRVKKEPVTEEEIDKIVEEVRAERYAESSH
ncbi:MAG: hypothetical protein ACPL4K_05920, partial [Candidatus Margulisiibacteriota bacterium]